jgi:threonine synthase
VNVLTSTSVTPITSFRHSGNYAVSRQPHLLGLQCLRCDAALPLSLLHTGCPVCAASGVHVSLRAAYSQQAGPAARVPYATGVFLGEGNTPLVNWPQLAQVADVASLHIKDESKNPTGSHKDRMSAIGMTQALDFGAHTVVLASSGNAAISAAHYAQAAGLCCEVATYAGMPAAYAQQLDALGATRFAFDNNSDRWSFVAQRAAQPGYFALTNHQLPALGSAPLAIEGYKAIACECHADGYLPEHIMVPTARGDLAWGIYAGFRDLLEAGVISILPKIWVVEPFSRLSSVLAGEDLHGSFSGHTAQFSTAGATVTYLQYQAATASAGGALVVPDAQARSARQLLTSCSISAELCAAAGFAAIGQLRDLKIATADSKVMLVLTANASRDPSYPDLN